MPKKENERWWLPGFLVGLLGLFFLIAGVAAGLKSSFRDPDVVGGLLFGGLLLVAGAVMARRRRPPT